jgi:hypothetical protein
MQLARHGEPVGPPDRAGDQQPGGEARHEALATKKFQLTATLISAKLMQAAIQGPTTGSRRKKSRT